MNNNRFMIYAHAIILGIMMLIAASFQPANAQTNFLNAQDAAKRFASNVRPAPAYVQARVLAANVAETMAFPATVRFVILSSTCNFYAKVGAAPTAAVPGADVTDGTASELNPTAYYLNPAGQSISVITPDASCVVTGAAYTGPVN